MDTPPTIVRLMTCPGRIAFPLDVGDDSDSRSLPSACFQLKVQQMEYGMPDYSFRDDLTVRLTRAQFLSPSTLSVCGLV